MAPVLLDRAQKHHSQPPTLTLHQGRAEEPTSGARVVEQICEVIVSALPNMPLDDPMRPQLAELAPLLARRLRRPPVALVREGAAGLGANGGA
jgi:hypothetical protein